MIGFNNQAFQQHASPDEMESLALNDNNNNNNNNNNYDDPLLSSPPRHQNPSSFNSFLEPPSYADAVFRSFDGDDVTSTSSSSDYLKISVTDPRTEENTFVTYLIATWTNLPEFNGTEFSVRRRFKDVVALSDRLAKCFRGYFIPLRPDKSVVESQVMQKQEFVEQRRIALEKYLNKLAVHPVIRRSEELRVFLQVEGKLSLVKTSDVASVVDTDNEGQSAKGGRDLLRLFKELRQSVSNDWGGTKPAVVEEDKEFLDKKNKLQEFEQELSNVSQQVYCLILQLFEKPSVAQKVVKRAVLIVITGCMIKK